MIPHAVRVQSADTYEEAEVAPMEDSELPDEEEAAPEAEEGDEQW